MSHIVEIQTKVRDLEGVRAACARLQLAPPTCGTARLFSDSATGLIVQLPGWRYPVVFDTYTGAACHDNYEGRWGAQQKLDLFLQAYAVETAKIEARKRGHTVTEQTLADGSIKVTVNVGGGL